MIDTTVHQLVVDGAIDDPATSMALRLRKVLRGSGRSEVYAVRPEPSLASEVRPLCELDTSRTTDVLVFHSGADDPMINQVLAATRQQIVLVHHLSPVRVRGATDTAERLSLQRRKYGLQLIRSKVAAAVAQNATAAAELEAIGYNDVSVIRLPMDIDTGSSLQRQSTMPHSHNQSSVVPYVMIALPRRCGARVEMGLQAVSLAQRVLDCEIGARVVATGVPPGDLARLKELTRRARVEHALFHEDAAVDDFARLLSEAAMLVSADPRGGGVVALQAMAFDVPAVVTASSSPDPAAEGALTLPVGAGPILLAEAVSAVHHDPALRQRLQDRGRSCVRALLAADETERLLRVLEGLGK